VTPFSLGMVLAIILVPSALVLGAWTWARRIGKRPEVPKLASRVAYGLVILSALAVVAGVVVGFVGGFGAVSGDRIDPSQKARVLAEGISEAMNCGALGFLLTVVTAAWLLFCSWRWRRA